MSVPTPVTETSIPCASLSCTVGGVSVRVESGGFDPDYDTDETTSNATGGFHTDGVSKRHCKLSLKIAMSSAAPTTGLVSGAIYPVLINCATMPTDFALALTPVGDGPALAGNFRLKMKASNVLDAKAVLHLQIEGMSQGKYQHLV